MRQEHDCRDVAVAQRLLLPLEGGQQSAALPGIVAAQGELELRLDGHDAVFVLGLG